MVESFRFGNKPMIVQSIIDLIHQREHAAVREVLERLNRTVAWKQMRGMENLGAE